MAVIITNMDMPKSCYDCWLKRSCKNAHVNGWLCNRRDDDCPLKSTDEMITQIENCSETYVAGWDGKRSKTAKEMKQDILEIIHKYCEKEQKDGRNS